MTNEDKENIEWRIEIIDKTIRILNTILGRSSSGASIEDYCRNKKKELEAIKMRLQTNNYKEVKQKCKNKTA